MKKITKHKKIIIVVILLLGIAYYLHRRRQQQLADSSDFSSGSGVGSDGYATATSAELQDQIEANPSPYAEAPGVFPLSGGGAPVIVQPTWQLSGDTGAGASVPASPAPQIVQVGPNFSTTPTQSGTPNHSGHGTKPKPVHHQHHHHHVIVHRRPAAVHAGHHHHKTMHGGAIAHIPEGFEGTSSKKTNKTKRKLYAKRTK